MNEMMEATSMGQDGKPWLHDVGKNTSVFALICLLAWLLFVYGFDDSYGKATFQTLKALLVAVSACGVSWLVKRLRAYWRTR